MNHLEKKDCCGECAGHMAWRAPGETKYKGSKCTNPQCKCHTPTPYSVLREKIRKAIRPSEVHDEEVEAVMSHIDEYRENLAKQIDDKFPGNSNETLITKREAKHIIRRT